jgi:hypothetical protein
MMISEKRDTMVQGILGEHQINNKSKRGNPSCGDATTDETKPNQTKENEKQLLLQWS